MALRKTIQLQNGLVANDAYIRIDTINGYKGEITISVNSYLSQQAFKDGESYLEATKFYKYVPDMLDTAPNNFKQGYEYLKTLPEYQGSVDILES